MLFVFMCLINGPKTFGGIMQYNLPNSYSIIFLFNKSYFVPVKSTK